MTQNSTVTIGDSIKVKDKAWDEFISELSRFGFEKGKAYEVSGVYRDGAVISIKGGYSTYHSEYFELCSENSTSAEVITKPSALDKQVSGNHYKDCGIQPIEYIHANGLSYLEGNVIKYTTRHSKKNGKADIEKAIHYLELILEMEYKGETE